MLGPDPDHELQGLMHKARAIAEAQHNAEKARVLDAQMKHAEVADKCLPEDVWSSFETGVIDDCVSSTFYATDTLDNPPPETEWKSLYKDLPDELFGDDAGDAAELANPKTEMGNKKPSITAIPGPALLHCAVAMQNGVTKYTKYNWRESKVPAATYVDAAIRHLLSWNDGEEIASDSGVHHLAHAMACCAILLDAIEGDHLIDNRGPPGKTADIISRMESVLPGLIQSWKDQKNAKAR